MSKNHFNVIGLTDEQVQIAREEFGFNKLNYKSENSFFATFKRIIKDPMVMMLLVAASIYFISGEIGDGLFLSGAIVLISFISLFQNSRSKNALAKLKDLSQPHSKVIRNEKIIEIKK